MIINEKPLQGSSGKSSKSKKGRSSVSSRSREGGSLPPTKFENVMLLEVRLPCTCTYKNWALIFLQGSGQPSPPRPSCIAWDTGGRQDMTSSCSTRTSMTRYMVDKISLEQTFNEVVQGGSWRVAAAVAQHLRQHDPQVGRRQRHRHWHGGSSGAQENQTDVQLPESCDGSFAKLQKKCWLGLTGVYICSGGRVWRHGQ